MKNEAYNSKTLSYRSEMMAAYKKEGSLPYLADYDVVLILDAQKHLVQEVSQNDTIVA